MILQSFVDQCLNVDGWKCLNCGRVVARKEKVMEPDMFGIYYQQHKNKNR
jgi:hypothetical protein